MKPEEAFNWIVEEVLRRLEARKKRALVIFTGAAIGFNEVMPQIKKLIDMGWNFKFLLSNSAEYVLTPELIKGELGVKEVILEREVKNPRSLYQDVNYFIIPTLTVNTATKVSLNIADTLVTNLVAHGIMEGIPIIAVKDGCDLKNSTRKQMGMDKSPSAYLAKNQEHLATLEQYGIKLVNSTDLLSSIENNKYSSDSISMDFNKKVLSRSDVIEAGSSQGVMYVPSTTIITSLAYDTAKKNGVKIIKK